MTTQAHAAFRYLVSIQGVDQAVFTECTLPVIEWEVEQVKEGGLNTSVLQLPVRRKPANISLKSGVGKSELLEWYFQSMGENFSRKNLTVTLLNSRRQPVMKLHIENALPVKWSGPQLKTDATTVAIQTLDLACGEVSVSYEEPAGN